MKALLKRIGERYERFFSVGEIRQESILQWYFGASLLYLFLTFHIWANSFEATIEGFKSGQAICWPYFPDCGKFFFLHDLYTDYSKGIFYAVIYGIMAAIVWCMWKKNWTAAHGLLVLLFLWEAVVSLLFSYSVGPYNYYHLFLTAVLLLVPFKEYFLRLAFVLFYFVSATIKFDSGWILGAYFSTLKNGLPLLPDVVIPVFTNLIIFSQVIGCWFLLSKNHALQRTALFFFILFHLYSVIFVGYLFPTAALLPLLVLFGPLYRSLPVPFGRRSIPGWSIIVLIIAFQAVGFLIPGDRRLTQEGNRFGMFMFDANHQCRIGASVYTDERKESSAAYAKWEYPAGTLCYGYYCLVGVDEKSEDGLRVRNERYESNFSNYRCDPYTWWARMRQRCAEASTQRIEFQFDHSINGGPYYRIVDTENICSLSYKAFGTNDWIMEPPEAAIVGYPVKNVYRH